MLDDQIKHLDEGSLLRLGEWLKRKYKQCAGRRSAAKKELHKNPHSVDTLREEWTKQVAAQTKPIPSE